MQNFNVEKRLSISILVTFSLGLLAALSGQQAQAGINFFDPLTGTAADLGAGTVTTGAYPAGAPSTGELGTPFSAAAGTNTLTFTAQGGAPGDLAFLNISNTKFDPTSLDNSTRNYDIASDTVIETVNLGTLNPTGPLQIDFGQGVTGFGLNVEDFSTVFESFTITAYNGGTLIGSPFTTPVIDSTGPNPGVSAFLGGQTTDGDLITQLVISSTSTFPDPDTGVLTDTGSSNDFVFGPVTVASSGAPVPEASTVVSSGIGLLLFGGLFWDCRRRKSIG